MALRRLNSLKVVSPGSTFAATATHLILPNPKPEQSSNVVDKLLGNNRIIRCIAYGVQESDGKSTIATAKPMVQKNINYATNTTPRTIPNLRPEHVSPFFDKVIGEHSILQALFYGIQDTAPVLAATVKAVVQEVNTEVSVITIPTIIEEAEDSMPMIIIPATTGKIEDPIMQEPLIIIPTRTVEVESAKKRKEVTKGYLRGLRLCYPVTCRCELEAEDANERDVCTTMVLEFFGSRMAKDEMKSDHKRGLA